jgi:glutamate/tyrosine decarboxylase-like PLP-dependent enzyme
MRRLGYAAVDLVVDYLQGLSDDPVGRRSAGTEVSALVNEPLPLDGKGADDCLAFLFERVLPGLTRVNHPRFHAFIPAPGNYYSAVAEMVAAATNPFVGSWLGGTTVAALELLTLRWIAEAVGYDTHAAGVLTSGGSIANLCAVAAARHRYGLGTLDNGVLYFSEQGHESAEKAARTLGYADDSLCRVPVDSRYRLQVDLLREQIAEDRRQGRHPFFVCANAGTTNTGAIDPLRDIGRLCHDEGLWFHVDGAYGGFAAISDSGRSRLGGMADADSLTLDPHKWLYCPMGVGCVLVRDRGCLEGAFRAEGDYLRDVHRDEVNFFDRGPELSRPARVFPVWMLLRTVGLNALAEQVQADLELALEARDLLAATPGLEIAAPVELSVVAFRHRARGDESEAERARRDHELMERTLAAGEIMLSTTELDGRSALRFVVQNHRTDRAELERSIAEIRRAAATLAP